MLKLWQRGHFAAVINVVYFTKLCNLLKDSFGLIYRLKILVCTAHPARLLPIAMRNTEGRSE